MTDTNLGTYSPDELLLVISVPSILQFLLTLLVVGLEGTMVTVSRPVISSTFVNGGDNTGFRVRRKNNAGIFNLSLHQSTASNDFLHYLWQNDIEASDNSWLFDLTLVDGTGRTSFSATQCYIENMPDISFSTEGTDGRTWVINSRTLKPVIGGNAKIPEEIVNTLTAMGVTVPARWLA